MLCVIQVVFHSQDSQSSVGSPMSRLPTQIIGAEDDYFDTEQDQVSSGSGSLSIQLLPIIPLYTLARSVGQIS